MPETRLPCSAARAVAALALVAALAGCGAAWQRGPAEPRLRRGEEVPLGPGDLIRLEVWGDREVSRDIAVGPDGRATIPLLGPYRVAGLTVTETAVALETGLQRWLREPRVTVALVEARSARFSVLGEVYEPGDYVWYQGETVASAVERASGFVPHTAAFWNVHLIRGALDEPKVWRVNLERILDAQAEDVPVEPGDLIYIPPRWATSLDRFVAQAFGPIFAILGINSTVQDVSANPGFVFAGGIGSDQVLIPPDFLVPGSGGTFGPTGGGGGNTGSLVPNPLPTPTPLPVPLPPGGGEPGG
jgi:polysaccharide export outer membrane protein